MSVRGMVVGGLVGVVVAAGATVLAAIPWGWSVLLGLVVAGFSVVAALLSGNVEPNWSAVPDLPQAATVLQASTLAARLEESATDEYRFRSRVQPRLRKLALLALRRRPELRDLADLADPRARAVLGAELHTMLTSSTGVLPTPQRIAELLSRLEEA